MANKIRKIYKIFYKNVWFTLWEIYHFNFFYINLLKAYVKRFPTCEMIPVFLGSDTVFEEESEDKATHSIERRCKLAVNAPYLLKKVCNVWYCITCDAN